jgi:hypothetical protein
MRDSSFTLDARAIEFPARIIVVPQPARPSLFSCARRCLLSGVSPGVVDAQKRQA